jgi:tripartite-type tricarboxylate transporter receptor subunit TctC
MAVLAMLACGASRSTADPVEDFYKGKVITYDLATTAGGSWDVYLRVLINHLSDHIPGHPKIVIQYMPGAGGVRMLDYMYNVAPKDGSVIATPLPTSLLSAKLDPELSRFSPQRFQWIGSMARIQDVISVWHTVPVKTIDDARKTQVTVGVTGAGSNTYFDIAMANNLLGTKFKPVQGYQGSADIDLAIENREVDGRANTWDGWAAAKPDWLAQKQIINLVQIGLSKLPEIGDVPLFSDLVQNADDKQVLTFLSAGIAVGRPIFLPPETPADRVAALRRAFAETMADPAYVTEAKARNISAGDWTPGDQIQSIVASAFDTPPALIDRAKAVLTLP